MRPFWPASEPGQADYETLRQAALADRLVCDVTAGRFERAGLAGLIVRPAARPVFRAGLRGAARPAWTPYGDPRLEALAAGYELLLGEADRRSSLDQGWLTSAGEWG
jgi:hypothetical protein